MNKKELYLYDDTDENRYSLYLMDTLLKICKFDSVTGNNVQFGLDEYLEQLLLINDNNIENDMLTRQVDFVKKSIKNILANIRDDVKREEVILPYYKARVINSRTIIQLNKVEGRTVREKLKNNPKIYTEKRYLSCDIAANQLLKEYLILLNKCLKIRKVACSSDVVSSNSSSVKLLHDTSRWLRSPQANEISKWTALIPNNTLLSDINYNKVWRSWLSLKKIEDDWLDVRKDIKENTISLLLLSLFSELRSMVNDDKTYVFSYIQSSLDIKSSTFTIKNLEDLKIGWINNKEIIFDTNYNKNLKPNKLSLSYDNKTYSISSDDIEFSNDFIPMQIKKIKNLFGLSYSKVSNTIECDIKETEYTAIDFYSGFPSISSNGEIKKLCDRFLFQKIKDNDTLLDCCNARGISIASNIQPIGLNQMFVDDDAINVYQDRYVRAISSKIFNRINVKKLFYIVPDILSEFDTSVFSKEFSLNTEEVKQLPFSIACAVQLMNSNNKIVENNSYIIANIVGTGITLTPLIARKSKYKNGVPGNIQWDRHPSRFIKTNLKDRLESNNEVKKLLEIYTLKQIVNKDYLKFNRVGTTFSNDYFNSVDDFVENQLKNIITIDDIINCNNNINCNKSEPKLVLANCFESSVTNCRNTILLKEDPLSSIDDYIKYEKVTISNEKDYFWSDYLPALSLETLDPTGTKKVLIALVEEGNKIINPMFDKSVSISINKDEIELPKGKDKYSFDLIQIDGASNIKYEAVVKSKEFPLSADTSCKMKLEYLSGSSNPYRLYICSKHKEFEDIKVVWEKKKTTDYSKFAYSYKRKQYKKEELIDKFNNQKAHIETILSSVNQPLTCLKYNKNTDRFEDVANTNSEGRTRFEDVESFLNKGKNFFFINDILFSFYSFCDNRYNDIPFTKQNLLNKLWNQKVCFVKENNHNKYRANQIFFDDEYSCYIDEMVSRPLLKYSYELSGVWSYNKVPDECDLEAFISYLFTEMSKYKNRNCWLFEDAIKRIICSFGDNTIDAWDQLIKVDLKNSNRILDIGPTVAFCMGNIVDKRQEKLLKRVIDNLNGNNDKCNASLKILSNVLWLNGNNINYLNQKDIDLIVEKLAHSTSSIITKLKFQGNKMHYQDLNTLLWFLELLVALSRVRNTQNKINLNILNVGSEYNKQFIKIIADLIETTESNNDLKKYITGTRIQVEKSEYDKLILPLLRLINNYLLCDGRTNTINITEYENKGSING